MLHRSHPQERSEDGAQLAHKVDDAGNWVFWNSKVRQNLDPHLSYHYQFILYCCGQMWLWSFGFLGRPQHTIIKASSWAQIVQRMRWYFHEHQVNHNTKRRTKPASKKKRLKSTVNNQCYRGTKKLTCARKSSLVNLRAMLPCDLDLKPTATEALLASPWHQPWNLSSRIKSVHFPPVVIDLSTNLVLSLNNIRVNQSFFLIAELVLSFERHRGWTSIATRQVWWQQGQKSQELKN